MTIEHLPPVPNLDGRLDAPLAAESFGEDFGRLLHQEPQSVLRPRSVDDIVRIVAYARHYGMTVAVNGQGGRDGQRESHSLYGQALTDGGIAIDPKSLSTIHEIGSGYAVVDGGARWSDLVTAAVETGQTPPVVNDFPYLSVGGTLSIGGFGPTSHRFGSQADHVEELQVVTGLGDLVTCSRTQNRELFDVVLAGAGQFGLIVRATVRLVPAKTTVRVMRIFYSDRDTYLRDAVAVMNSGLIDDLAGAVMPAERGGWEYVLLAGIYHTPPEPTSEREVLDSLAPGAELREMQEVPYLDYVFRLNPLWDQLQGSGHWQQAKPRFTVFLPAARASEFAETMLAELSPSDMGAGGVRLTPIDAAAIKQPMFVMPSRTGPVVEMTMGRFPAPDHPDIPGLLAQNRRFYDLAVSLGAKRYLYGAIPDMTAEDWQLHYGDRWAELCGLKEQYDPDHVLTPGQRIFS